MRRRSPTTVLGHHILAGGYLAIHDIFPDPADGGQALHEIYKLRWLRGY